MIGNLYKYLWDFWVTGDPEWNALNFLSFYHA